MVDYNSKWWDKEPGVNKEQTVALLQSIAMSETIEKYHSNVSNLESSEIWKRMSSESFLNWIEKTWLLLDEACLK